MEPVTGFGLACGILQVVDFSAQAVKVFSEISSSAESISAENASHMALATHLDVLARNIAIALQRVEDTPSGQQSPEDIAFQSIVHECSELAKTLLSRLRQCGVVPIQHEPQQPQQPQQQQQQQQQQPQQPQQQRKVGGGIGARTRARARATWKSLWNKRDIDNLANRLQGYRTQIVLHITTKNQQSLHDIAAHMTANSHLYHQAILDKLANIEQTVQELRDAGFSATGSDTTQCPSPVSGVATSVEPVNTSGSFMARHLHVQCEEDAAASDGNLAATLRGALEPPWARYQEAFLHQISTEMKGTATAELEAIRGLMDRALAEVGTEMDETGSQPPRRHREAPEEVDDLGAISNPYGRGATSDLDVIKTYTRSWVKSTPVGSLSFDISRHQHFLPGLLPIRATIARLIFTPFMSWLTVGMGITNGLILQYESRQDTRRSWPSLFPSLETFRVLGRDEPVWGLLKVGEVGPIRALFAEGSLHPLDRNSYGRTLLHV